MSKAYIVIEQIDNGFLVDASDEDTDTGEIKEARFAVSDPNQLLAVLAAALFPRDTVEPDLGVEIEEGDEVTWPDDPPKTMN